MIPLRAVARLITHRSTSANQSCVELQLLFFSKKETVPTVRKFQSPKDAAVARVLVSPSSKGHDVSSQRLRSSPAKERAPYQRPPRVHPFSGVTLLAPLERPKICKIFAKARRIAKGPREVPMPNDLAGMGEKRKQETNLYT